MTRYMAVEQDGQRYVAVRYTNFAALDAPVEPIAPWALVPLYNDIGAAVAEARKLELAFTTELTTMGALSLERRLHPDTHDEHALAYLAKLDMPLRIFRGERSLSYSIMPTRYRISGQGDSAPVIRERVEFETRCADDMRAYLAAHGVPGATNEQARAAARHYGAPSSFVDFTFSPDVAAAFAHPLFSGAERERGADLGILYSIALTDLERLFGLAAWAVVPEGGRDIHWINVADVWRIPFTSFDPERGSVEAAALTVRVPDRLVAKPITIRTRTVPGIARIAAQQGLFIDALFEDAADPWAQELLWTVIDFASTKWCFIRQDFQYEDSASGITARSLFPADDPAIAEMARGYSNWPTQTDIAQY